MISSNGKMISDTSSFPIKLNIFLIKGLRLRIHLMNLITTLVFYFIQFNSIAQAKPLISGSVSLIK